MHEVPESSLPETKILQEVLYSLTAACNNSNLHVVQAGNLGAVDGRRLPRLLVVAAPRANQVTGQAAGVAERQATGGVAQALWTPP